jgi:dUTP pyrophosphatase
MKVNIKLKEEFKDFGLPKYHTKDSAAVDLRAAIENEESIKPGERKLIPTGIYMEIPEGYMLHITPRSGLAIKKGISLVNSPGIIDADYRGEIGIILINHGREDFIIERGDRIAQASFVKFEAADWNEVEDVSENETRGEGGFGSTGIK